MIPAWERYQLERKMIQMPGPCHRESHVPMSLPFFKTPMQDPNTGKKTGKENFDEYGKHPTGAALPGRR
jgi:hypothetical protein